MDKFEIREIEEILVNAFPAIEREFYDGWILNFSNGYTYRANAIYPFYPSTYSIEKKIKHCEEQYRQSFLPVVYKMTSASGDVLDAVLESHGYRIVKYVDVMCRTLDDHEILPIKKIDLPYEMVVMKEADDEWLDGVNQLIHIPYRSMCLVQKEIFTNIALPIICVKVRYRGHVIGTGLGVIERHYVGLYAIHVKKAFRGQGIAEQICIRIMEQGRKMGADKVHLQVRRGNYSAVKMYRKLGLKRIYTQWFRMKSWPESKRIFD